MFALLMACLIIVFSFKSLLYDNKRERISKDIAKKNGKRFYVDRYGRYVNVDNDVPYTYEQKMVYQNGSRPRKGDLLIINPRTDTVIRNISQNRRDERDIQALKNREEAAKKGERFFICEFPRRWHGVSDRPRFECDPYYELPVVDKMWCDINTNEKYFLYTLNVWNKEENKTIKANLLWSLTNKKFEIVIDEYKYSAHDLILIKEKMKSMNERYGSSYNGWKKLHAWNSSEAIHII